MMTLPCGTVIYRDRPAPIQVLHYPTLFSFEREAWEAEKLASELITEAVRQKNAAEAGDVVEILGAAATEDVDDLDGPDSIGLQ